MAGCDDRVFGDIKATCAEDFVPGVEPNAYMFSFEDFTATFDATVKTKITAIDIAATKKGWLVKGVKVGLNYKTEMVPRTDSMDKHKHTFMCKSKQIAAADIDNIDKTNNIVVVVERKTKNADGTFVVLGATGGLWKSAQSREANTNDSDMLLEFSSMETSLEPHSEYVFTGAYATNKAALDALLVTQV